MNIFFIILHNILLLNYSKLIIIFFLIKQHFYFCLCVTIVHIYYWQIFQLKHTLSIPNILLFNILYIRLKIKQY
jgi:hypothetical protein